MTGLRALCEGNSILLRTRNGRGLNFFFSVALAPHLFLELLDPFLISWIRHCVSLAAIAVCGNDLEVGGAESQ